MKLIPLIMLAHFILFLGALSHESDMQRGCKERGEASGFLGDIKCSPLNKGTQHHNQRQLI